MFRGTLTGASPTLGMEECRAAPGEVSCIPLWRNGKTFLQAGLTVRLSGCSFTRINVVCDGNLRCLERARLRPRAPAQPRT